MSAKFIIPDWLVPEPTPPSPVDPHRVESLVNRFIAAKQAALFEAPDAFYRLEGGDAVDGAPAIAERLQGLRTAALDLARDDGERAALGPRLDAHIDDAMDGIGRHVAAQRTVFRRRTLGERQALIRRAAELEHDNDGKIAGLAEAQASAAQELARLDGIAPDSPEEADQLNSARSQILRTAIDQRIATRKNSQALALFDRAKDRLTPADQQALELPIGVARDDTATDAWLAREDGKDGAPLVDRLGLDETLSDQHRHILQAKIAARESAEESRRYATVKGLDDQFAKATATMATEPSAYRIGTLSALADAYDAAGATQQGSNTRRFAELELFFLSFAQLGPVAQQKYLQGLSTPERTFAEAILHHQINLSPDGEMRGDSATLSDARSDVASDGTLIAQAAPDDPAATTAPRRGVAPATEPPSNDPATEKAFQDFEGEHLLLSNGKWVVDPNSPTGYVMTPSNDLKHVVAAARHAKAEHPDWKLSNDLALLNKKTRDELEAVLRANLGQGGTFDYQRRPYAPGKDGFTQLRQFRSIANINVGLFCQQLGLSLRETLGLAGLYAVKNSSNRNLLNLPYVLDADTEKYTRVGYEIGEKKLF